MSGKTYVSDSSNSYKSSKSHKSSDSSQSSESSDDLSTEYSSDDSYSSDNNTSDSSTYISELTFEDKNEQINLILDDLFDKKSIDNINICTNGKWCNVNKFLHTSEDRLSTVGSGYLHNNKDINFIWKVCESWDYTIFAEYNIMKRLEEMFEWNPHFVRAYKMVELPVHPSFSHEPKKFIPFNVKNKNEENQNVRRMCKNQFLLMEELCDHLSVYDYFYMVNDRKDGNKVNDILCSIIMQTLISNYNANKYCDFTHYDFHTSNILMEETDDNYRLYISDGFTQFVKTYGLTIVAIDTGYSYADVLNNTSDDTNNTIDTCITNFHRGYTPICSNINHDFRTFLLNVAWDYPKDSPETKNMKTKINDVVSGWYKNKHIDMKTGWLKINRDKIFVLKSYINDLTKLCSKKSILYDYSVQCFDVLSHLLRLPFKQNSEKINMKIHSEKFSNLYNAFIKIENKCGTSSTFKKFIWKSVVHIYKISDINNFSEKLRMFLHEYDIVVNNFNFTILFNAFEEYIPLYEHAVIKSYHDIEKQNNIDFLKVPTPVNIIKTIETLFKPNYKLQKHDVIIVYDAIKQRKSIIEVSVDELDMFNSLDHDGKIAYLTNKYNS